MSEFSRLSWNQSERTSVHCDTKQHVKVVLPQSIWDGLLDITVTPCDCAGSEQKSSEQSPGSDGEAHEQGANPSPDTGSPDAAPIDSIPAVEPPAPAV